MTSTFRAVAGLLCATLLGSSVRAAETPMEDTEITSDNFDSRSTEKETLTILWDHVVITGTNLRISCDRAEIVSLRAGDAKQIVAKQNRFKSLLLTGHVTIFQRDSNRTATCGRAEILPAQDKITLTESPKIVDLDKEGKPEFTYIGEELLLLRGERRVQGKGVKIVGPPIKDLGFDKNKPGPVPEDAPKPEPPK